MPISSTGYYAYTADDLLTVIKTEFEAKLAAAGDLEPVDYERDTVLGSLAAATAYVCGLLSEEIQLLADQRDVDNAKGVFLSSIARLLGFDRNAASFGTMTLEFTATAATTVPAGTRVYDLEDPEHFWATDTDLVFASAGTDTVTATCLTAGLVNTPSLTFGLNTSVAYLSETITGSDVTLGEDEESDTLLRARILTTAARGATTVAALEADLLEVEGVTGAVVIENELATVQILEGTAVPPNSIAVYVTAGGGTVDVSEVIAAHCPAGIYCVGADEERTVTFASGATKRVAWSYGIETTVDVDIAITVKSGYTLVELSSDIETAVENYFSALLMGQSASILELTALMATIEGVKGAVVELDGATSDIDPARIEVLILGVLNVT